MPLSKLALGMAAAIVVTAAPAHAAAPIAGRWLTDNGEAVIQIAPCGKTMCGRLAKVLKPKPGGKAIQGAIILSELVDDGDAWKGRVFNPESGKSYKAKLYRNPDDTLKVEGCVAFMCSGPTWKPAS